MIYELRSYDIVPGRMPAMNARFQNHTVGLFKKHAIEVVGFWEAMIGTSNVLHYIVRSRTSGTGSVRGRPSAPIRTGSVCARNRRRTVRSWRGSGTRSGGRRCIRR